VDSELLVRLARQHALPSGIDVPTLLRDLARCEGHIAAVLAWASHPETVILIRRDRPLWLAWQTRRRLLAYASERPILAQATLGESGWHIESMSENMALVFNITALPGCAAYPFN
jgi:glucosamine 6-phosphate synthetase-like amidotransferase/phosphosugar isomerase protein